MAANPSVGHREIPADVLEAVPTGWSADGRETLDADLEIAQGNPPLRFADGGFGLIWSGSAFAGLADRWGEWLLELRRLLAHDGLLIVTLGAPARFEELARSPWREDEIGMTVLPGDDAEPLVFHSPWWLRAHWGRAFEVLDVGGGAKPRVVLRRGPSAVSADDLARPEPAEPRELTAALANRDLLLARLRAIEARHRRALDRQREELGRELMRKSFQLAEVEWASKITDSPAMAVVAEYEATTSWKITRPLRAAGRFVRRLR